MGLDLALAITKTGGLSFLKSTPNARQLAGDFLEIARQKQPLGKLAMLSEYSASEFGVQLLPIEENVEFRQEGSSVIISARTSSVGPGYHAYLVQLLDEVIALRKYAGSETEEWFDETGYFTRRNFAQLQSEMNELFQAISRMVLEHSERHPDADSFLLSFQMEGLLSSLKADSFPGGINALALTPRGPRDKAFFDGKGAASDHYPWWEEGLTPASACGLAEALLWTEYPWREPRVERERAVEEVISALLSKAGQMGARLKIEFDSARHSTAAPAALGTGYRRHDSRRTITGSWSLIVPGYFLSEFDDGTMSCWFAGRHIYASSFSVSMKDGTRPDPFKDKGMTISREIDGVLYQGRVDLHDSDGEVSWRLWGGAVDKDSLATITVIFENPQDRAWAEKVLFSLGR
jgi:hypothetical protein